MSDVEQPLEGGVTGAVRVGDTVRKPAGSWTPTVQSLLRHLRTTGFIYAPEPLGVDDAGYSVPSFPQREKRVLSDLVSLGTVARDEPRRERHASPVG